jgi:uncharacterized membrane protein
MSDTQLAAAPAAPSLQGQSINLPPLTPGVETSEYAMALKIQKEANSVAKLTGALSAIGAGLIINPVTAPIGAIVAPVAGIVSGVALLVSWFVGMRYMDGRVDVKTATATAVKLAEDIDAVTKAIKAARK